MAPIASARTAGQLRDLLALRSLTLTDGELVALRAAAQ
jgi:aryl-alcohol dehydrogenase-like predicted oxidoreductase